MTLRRSREAEGGGGVNLDSPLRGGAMRGMQSAAVGQKWYEIASERLFQMSWDAEGATAVKVKCHWQAAGPSLGWSRSRGKIRRRKEKGALGKHTQKTKGRTDSTHVAQRSPMADQPGHPVTHSPANGIEVLPSKV